MEKSHVYNLRLPAEVWAKLQKEARQESRSVNAQVVHILRERYDLPANGDKKPRPQG